MLELFHELHFIPDRNPWKTHRVLTGGVSGRGIAHDCGKAIPAPLVEVECRKVVVGDGHEDTWPALSTREHLRFGHKVTANACALPHGIGRERDDVEDAIDEPPGQGPCD